MHIKLDFSYKGLSVINGIIKIRSANYNDENLNVDVEWQSPTSDHLKSILFSIEKPEIQGDPIESIYPELLKIDEFKNGEIVN